MACEYLLLNGAPINIQDAKGKTPLHLATEQGTLIVTFFAFAFYGPFFFITSYFCRSHCPGLSFVETQS